MTMQIGKHDQYVHVHVNVDVNNRNTQCAAASARVQKDHYVDQLLALVVKTQLTLIVLVVTFDRRLQFVPLHEVARQKHNLDAEHFQHVRIDIQCTLYLKGNRLFPKPCKLTCTSSISVRYLYMYEQ